MHSPCHWAHEAFRRRRRERGAHLEELRHECRIVGDPVAHHDAATRFRHADHLLGYVEGLGCKHGTEYRDGQIERMVAHLLQVARVSFLKLQTAETCLHSSSLPGSHEFSCNVDSSYFSPQTGKRHGRGAIAATEVQSAQGRRYPDRFYDALSRFTHEGGNLSEIAFFPQGFVRIHGNSLRDIVSRPILS